MAAVTSARTAWQRVWAKAGGLVRAAMVASVLLSGVATIATVSAPAAHAEEEYCGGC